MARCFCERFLAFGEVAVVDEEGLFEGDGDALGHIDEEAAVFFVNEEIESGAIAMRMLR